MPTNSVTLPPDAYDVLAGQHGGVTLPPDAVSVPNGTSEDQPGYWHQVAKNLVPSAVNFLKNIAPGPTGSEWSPEQTKWFQDAAAAEKAGKPLPQAPTPSGSFSQAHPDFAQQHPTLATAADSIEALASKLSHPADYFRDDPVGAANTYGNLARGAVEAGKPLASAAGSAAKSVAAKIPDLPKVPQGVIDAGHVANMLPVVNSFTGPATAAAGFWNKAIGWLQKTRSQSTSPAVVNPPLVIQPEGFSSTVRPAWRQSVIDELNRQAAAPDASQASTPQSSAPAAEPQAPATANQSASTQANPFEQKARNQKAQALARFLYLGGQGLKTEDAAMLNPDHWRQAAKGAVEMNPKQWPNGMGDPSPATAKQALTELQKLWDAHAVAQQLSDSMTPPGGPPQ